MTITKRDLKKYSEGTRVTITKEEEAIILERFGTEPDEWHTWTEQDIYTQIRNILAGKKNEIEYQNNSIFPQPKYDIF